VLWRGMRPSQNRTGQIFRLAAAGLHHDLTPMGDYFRRMKSKLGPVAATTAAAHKIAIVFYTQSKKQVEYDSTIWAERDADREKRFEEELRRQARQRGYKLVRDDELTAA
jgi:transposase